MGRWVRRLALLTALVGWSALAIQLAIIIAAEFAAGQTVGAGIAAALWRFLGYFTILTNLFVAVVASAIAFAPRSAWAGLRVRVSAMVSIVLVGIIYAALLRHVWDPQGWQKVADNMLHVAVPLLFLATWIASDHGALAWRDAVWGLVPALGYFVYALARGAADGWYAYWFLDLGKLGAAKMAMNAMLLTAVFLVASLLAIAADKALARRA